MALLITINETETALNSEITDSVVQPGTEVLGVASANAGGIYYQVNSQSLGLAALNATNAQMQNIVSSQAATPVDITTLYARTTAPDVGGVFEQVPKHRSKKIARVKLRKK
jgi:hypothetical protein